MAIPEFKDIIELLKKGSTLEAQEKIVELRESYLSLKDEMLKLREENQALREHQHKARSLTFDGHFYWNQANESKEGPFCQACWDRNQTLARLVPRRTRGAWDCNVCNKFFTDGNYSPPENTVVQSDYF